MPSYLPGGKKVEPIRSTDAIRNIKRRLQYSPRNHAIFVVGINTGYRASELLSIRVGDIAHLGPGDRFELRQRKTRKYRAVTINQTTHDAVHKLLEWRTDHYDARWTADDAYLFSSIRPDKALGVQTLSRLVKKWCAEEGLRGNYASHTLRKTWGFMQRTKQNAPVPLLMRAFGHATQQQTMTYLCIQDEEIDALYTGLEL